MVWEEFVDALRDATGAAHDAPVSPENAKSYDALEKPVMKRNQSFSRLAMDLAAAAVSSAFLRAGCFSVLDVRRASRVCEAATPSSPRLRRPARAFAPRTSRAHSPLMASNTKTPTRMYSTSPHAVVVTVSSV
jgi:hypothetical protein